ncbi:MAG: alpha/beta hydrolase, partial [Jatrophihabitantaceae bacterium]
IGTVHDPATPYAAAGVLAKALGSGVLLSWDGEGHTAYPKTSCIRTKVDSYLISDTLPAGDSCPRS